MKCVFVEETAEIRTGKAKRGERIPSHTEDDLQKEKYNGEIGYRVREHSHETGNLDDVDSIMPGNMGYAGVPGREENYEPHDQAFPVFAVSKP